MAASLPRKVPQRREHTGDPAIDRAQRLAQVVATAHEQTKAYALTTQATLASFMRGIPIVIPNANVTLTAAQLAAGLFYCTGALSTNRQLGGFTRPQSSDGSDWYWHIIWNATTGGFNVVASDGVSLLAVPPAGRNVVLFTNTGPVL